MTISNGKEAQFLKDKQITNAVGVILELTLLMC